MTKTIPIILLLSMLATSKLIAQQQLFSNQSVYLQSIDNIAATATTNAVQAIYRRNWMPLNYSPELLLLHVEGPLYKNKDCWDLKVMSFATGILKQTEVKAGFSHQLLNKPAHKLSFGMRAGLIRHHLNISALNAQAPEELANFDLNGNSIRPALDAGLYYLYKVFTISLSSNNFSSSRIKTQPSPYQILSDNQVVFTWHFKTNTGDLHPAIAVRSTQGMPLLGSIALQYSITKIAALAIAYRTNKSFFLNAQLHLNHQFSLLYSFDYSAATHRISGAGNELGFTYHLK